LTTVAASSQRGVSHPRTEAGLPVRPTGWRPAPFREFIVKVASRCDLDCDYCYMFTMADQGWRHRPRLIPDPVIDRVARSIGAHVSRHRLDNIAVILHGGEPLLAGPSRLARVAASIRAQVPAATRVRISVQTNGVLLDAAMLAALRSAGIRIAVSLDGDADTHDRHRRRPNGSGSYAAVTRALRLLNRPAHRALFAGLLCVVDLANDPVGVFQSLARFDPPVIDFLLPYGNWSTPPPGRPPDDSTPYGDWLTSAFDAWYAAPAGRPEIRLFREVITLLVGGSSHSEQVGLSPAAMIVFNVDGSIEQVDSLRSAYHGAVDTGLSVFTHDLEAALEHPGIVIRQLGLSALGEQCRRCPLVNVCGGGHYAHRYRHGDGFRNPSVYCADLAHLVHHIRARVEREVSLLRGSAR
jgi:uncharacterized protein